MPDKGQILRLYKSLLKYVRSLEHSDQAFLTNRIRQEFRKVPKEADQAYTNFLYEVGLYKIFHYDLNLEGPIHTGE